MTNHEKDALKIVLNKWFEESLEINPVVKTVEEVQFVMPPLSCKVENGFIEYEATDDLTITIKCKR